MDLYIGWFHESDVCGQPAVQGSVDMLYIHDKTVCRFIIKQNVVQSSSFHY